MCLLSSWVKRYNTNGQKIWKQLLDSKYGADNPNLWCASVNGASQFFRGLMWAAQAARLGYRWKVGDGRKIKFWEDNWLGQSSLAIQYWEIYVLVHEKMGQ